MSIEGAQGTPSYIPPADPALDPSFVNPIAQPLRLIQAWSRADTLIALLAVVSALLFYLVRLDRPYGYIYDEVYHAYTAARLAEGNPDPYNPFAKVPERDKQLWKVSYVWDHPALAKLPMEAAIKLFGDNPFGWRIASAIFGALGIGVFYGLSRALFDRLVALIATALLLLDGLWFVQSRTSMNDIFLVFFLLLAYLTFYFYLTHSTVARWRYLLLTGVGLGLALATKWSAVYSIGMMGLVAGLREAWLALRRIKIEPRRAIVVGIAALGGLALTFVALPLALYVGGYVQYFLMGFTWSDWRELQWQMWHYHSTLKACHDWASPWWTWPLMLKGVWYYGPLDPYGNPANIFNVGNPVSVASLPVAQDYQRAANVFTMGNPLSWWLYLPAIIAVGVVWIRGRFRSIALGLILLGYLGQWLPWAFSPRISYFYHMLPSVPFGVLALAYVLGRLRGHPRLIGGYLALVVLSFAFFYPIYTGVPLPRQPVLHLSRFTPFPDLSLTDIHYWLPSWRPGNPWPFRCPMPQNNPLYWLSALVPH